MSMVAVSFMPIGRMIDLATRSLSTRPSIWAISTLDLGFSPERITRTTRSVLYPNALFMLTSLSEISRLTKTFTAAGDAFACSFGKHAHFQVILRSLQIVYPRAGLVFWAAHGHGLAVQRLMCAGRESRGGSSDCVRLVRLARICP